MERTERKRKKREKEEREEGREGGGDKVKRQERKPEERAFI